VKQPASPGEWLIARYTPVTLFSLRSTYATSKGGKTLLVPTPYAVKMALIDSCFRAFPAEEAEAAARNIFDLVKAEPVRVKPPEECIVQNTFLRVLQPARDALGPGLSGAFASTAGRVCSPTLHAPRGRRLGCRSPGLPRERLGL